MTQMSDVNSFLFEKDQNGKILYSNSLQFNENSWFNTGLYTIVLGCTKKKLLTLLIQYGTVLQKCKRFRKISNPIGNIFFYAYVCNFILN